MAKRQIFFVLIFSLIFAVIFQWTRWKGFDFVDSSMWANQAKYVETGDREEFNALTAYGHPGGTIIEGTIALHNIFKISYADSLVIFMTVFNSMVIAVVCALCFLLKKNNLWWIVALGVLSLSGMYDFATPPSAIVSPLIALLCLLTLYFYEHKEKLKNYYILLFSLIVGLAVATRADIGIFCSLFFLAFLKFENTINWKKLFAIALGSFIFFVLFDPFMWFMPIQHIKDLISKIVFHYAEFAPTHMSLVSLLSISMLSLVGFFLSIVLLFLRKKIISLLPAEFTMMLIFTTVFLYFIFLTSNFQTQRYFQPIIFIWEIFLPLFIFNLTKEISFKLPERINNQTLALKIVNIFIVVILVSYQTFLFYLFILDRVI